MAIRMEAVKEAFYSNTGMHTQHDHASHTLYPFNRLKPPFLLEWPPSLSQITPAWFSAFSGLLYPGCKHCRTHRRWRELYRESFLQECTEGVEQ